MTGWPDTHIFPLIAGDPGDRRGLWDIQACVGTAFIFGDQVVTCWHCVEDAVTQNMEVALGLCDPDGTWRAAPLSFVQHPDGHDLATARSPFRVDPPLQMGSGHGGLEVYSYGYPLTEKRRRPSDGLAIFKVWSRIFKGYIASSTEREFPGRPDAPGYELDMPCPGGMSGAPLLRDNPGRGGTRQLVGVVQGQSTLAGEVALGIAYPSELLPRLLSTSETRGSQLTTPPLCSVDGRDGEVERRNLCAAATAGCGTTPTF